MRPPGKFASVKDSLLAVCKEISCVAICDPTFLSSKYRMVGCLHPYVRLSKFVWPFVSMISFKVVCWMNIPIS